MLEGPRISVRVRAQSLALRCGRRDSNLGCHRVAMNSEIVQELGAVRVGLEQTAQNSRAARDERTSREPHVHPIRRWKRRHGSPLADTLNADLRNRQPILD
jgi:hypothetical protein